VVYGTATDRFLDAIGLFPSRLRGIRFHLQAVEDQLSKISARLRLAHMMSASTGTPQAILRLCLFLFANTLATVGLFSGLYSYFALGDSF
jgi:hypothetical protein